MTYLPPKTSATAAAAGTLAAADTIQVVQGGVTKTATLAVLQAYVTGSTGSTGASSGATGSTAGGGTGSAATGGSTAAPAPAPAETLAITTPGAQAAGKAFTLTGTYTNGPPAALDYSLDGGGTWTAAASPTIGSGAFSFSLTVATANAAQTVKARDHAAQAVTATSNSFNVYTPSPKGAFVGSVGPVITDNAGNTYGISSGGYVVTNGKNEDGTNGTPTTANVVAEYWDGTQFWQKNSAGNWFTRTGLAAAYTGPTPLPASPAKTLVTTAGPTVVDGAGNVYAINSGGYVTLNGVQEDGTNGTRTSANVVAIYWDGTSFYQKNSGGSWYQATSATAAYTGPVADPTAAPATTTPVSPGAAAGPGPTAASGFITVNCGAPTSNVLQPQLFGVAMASDVDFTPWANTTLQNAAKVTAGFGLPGMYARINSNDSSLNSDGSANLTYVDRVIAAMPKIIDMATGEFTYNVGYASNDVWNTNATQIAAGAKAIAQRFVNAGVKPQGYEVFNEPNPDSGTNNKVPTATYVNCFNAIADAILSVDGNAKIIGPNDSFMATDRIGGLASGAGGRVGEFSYHLYQVNSSIGDADAFSQAISRASSDASRLRATSGAGTIPARLSEYNMDGNPPGDLRQLTIKGAVWNALILHSVFTADSLHTHGAIWDWLGDGNYSQIIDPNNNPQNLVAYSVVPSGYMLKTARQYMGGKQVPITTAPSGNIKTLATMNGNRVSVWLINYDTSASFSGQVALSQWPVNTTGNGTVKMSQLNQSNATPLVSSVAVTNGVTASVTLPPISVSVITSAA